MASQLVNVNAEMNQMKQLIEDVILCKAKIAEVEEEVWLYKINFKANLLAILTTLHMIACAVVRFNPALIGVGVVIAVSVVIMFFHTNVLMSEDSKSYSKIFGVLLCALVVCSIVCFMFSYNIVPVVIALILWIVLVISNFRMKNQIWRISTSI